MQKLTNFGFKLTQKRKHPDQDDNCESMIGTMPVGPVDIDVIVQKTPSTSSCNTEKNTSKHRATGFYTGWLNKYCWLQYKENDGMFCAFCIKHKQMPKSGTVWVLSGCKTFREDAIKRHQNSSVHVVAAELEANCRISASKGGIEQAMQQAMTLEQEAFVASLRCMYWLIKNELPHTTKYGSLLDLAKSLGCKYLDNIHIADAVKYRSDRTVREMVLSLGEVVRRSVLADLKAAKFFSYLVDETTDIAVMKQLILYGMYCKEGKPRVSFLGLEELIDGKADTIVKKMLEFSDNNQISVDHLAGLGSDGAAVMLGRQNGVAKKLKEVSPILVENHCMAHREALAVKAAANEVNVIKKFNQTLDHLYRYYENSAVRMAALKEIQQAMENPVLKPKQAKAVRWLSHDAACDTLRKIFPSVVTSLHREASERHDPQAVGLVKMVENWEFFSILCMMCDILPHLSILSKCFQTSALNFTDIKRHLHSTLEILRARLLVPGQYFSSVSPELVLLNDNGLNLPFSEPQLNHFTTSVHDKFIRALIAQIEQRFPSTELLDAFSIFDPSMIQEVDIEQLEGYGSDSLEIILGHYATVVDVDASALEWASLRSLMFTEKMAFKTISDVLHALTTKYVDLYPNISTLAELAMIIPMSTADCERGFSALNRIKTQERNRLSASVLNALMLISIEGPDVDSFPYLEAAAHWAGLRNRRLDLGLAGTSKEL